MADQNITGSFSGCQFGNYNTMVNNLSSNITNKNEVQALLLELQEAIQKTQEMDKYAKIDTLDSLSRLVESLTETNKKQEADGIVYFWKKIVNAAKDIGPIFSILQTLGSYLSLPLL